VITILYSINSYLLLSKERDPDKECFLNYETKTFFIYKGETERRGSVKGEEKREEKS